MSYFCLIVCLITFFVIKCLAQGYNTVPLARLEPAIPQSQVKHSSTEPPRSYSVNTIRTVLTLFPKVAFFLVSWSQFGPSSCLTKHWAWSTSKLFDTLYHIPECIFQKSRVSKKNKQPRINHEKLPRRKGWEEISFLLLFHGLIESFLCGSVIIRQTQLTLYSQLTPFVICW